MSSNSASLVWHHVWEQQDRAFNRDKRLQVARVLAFKAVLRQAVEKDSLAPLALWHAQEIEEECGGRDATSLLTAVRFVKMRRDEAAERIIIESHVGHTATEAKLLRQCCKDALAQ